MDTLAVNPMSPESLIVTFGLIGILVILYAETGLLIGFFLPGDSLLFLAGIATSDAAGRTIGTSLPLAALLVGAPLAAIAGAQTGHYLGMVAGRRFARTPERRVAVERAEEYFRRYGVARALVLARFVGVVRTFINPVAGMLNIPTRTFLTWNVVGALLWTDGLILVGYFAGDRLPEGVDAYLLPIVLTIMAVSLLPLVVAFVKAKLDRSGGVNLAEYMEEHNPRIIQLQEFIAGELGPCRPVLTASEAVATAQLLDVLHKAHPHGPVGDLTGELSTRILDRLQD